MTHAISRELRPALTFDDILLVPQFSTIQSRSQVSLATRITHRRTLDLPIWSANMDSVTGGVMAAAMANLGGIGVIHRYLSIAEQVAEVERAVSMTDAHLPLAAAIGVKGDIYGTLEDRARALVDAGVAILVIDIAHGDHVRVQETLAALKRFNLGGARDGKFVEIVAGNVATPEGVERLVEAGADAVKVGVGPGSMCTTRIMTGHGVAQFSAILEASSMCEYCIADGGLRTSGDIVKALAAGASSVMLGSMLAGTDEAPGLVTVVSGERVKTYRGMASFEAQTEFFNKPVDTPEGVATLVACKGPVADIVRTIIGGIKSGCSYSGVDTIADLRTRARYRRVTVAGLKESHAHGLK